MIQLPAALVPHAALIKLAAVAAAALAVFVAGVAAGKRWSAADIERERAAHAQAIAAAESAARQAVEQARTREATIVARTEEIVEDARQTVETMRAHAAAADAAAVSLRDAVARYAARRCPAAPPATAGRGTPADTAAGVQDADRLLVLLGELDGRAGALARHADAARSAGIACERAWDAARAELSR